MANLDQRDCDNDDRGDVCDPDSNDTDQDGFCDSDDSCPDDPDNDADGDGFCGDVDNCPAIANSNQHNCDGDSKGDACDADALDSDGDGIDDACETVLKHVGLWEATSRPPPKTHSPPGELQIDCTGSIIITT